jgi:hypothetical protein
VIDATMDELLDELTAAYEHRLGVLRRGHSDYVRENGRHGGSPWAELMAAVEAVMDARHAAILDRAAVEHRLQHGT